MCICVARMCVRTAHACLLPTEDKKGIGSHGSEAIDVGAENRTRPSEPCLQPQKKVLLKSQLKTKQNKTSQLFISSEMQSTL